MYNKTNLYFCKKDLKQIKCNLMKNVNLFRFLLFLFMFISFYSSNLNAQSSYCNVSSSYDTLVNKKKYFIYYGKSSEQYWYVKKYKKTNNTETTVYSLKDGYKIEYIASNMKGKIIYSYLNNKLVSVLNERKSKWKIYDTSYFRYSHLLDKAKQKSDSILKYKFGECQCKWYIQYSGYKREYYEDNKIKKVFQLWSDTSSVAPLKYSLEYKCKKWYEIFLDSNYNIITEKEFDKK